MSYSRSPMRAILRVSIPLQEEKNMTRTQGWSIVPIFRSKATIWFLVNVFPIITLFLHARMANIARAFVHLTICPAGLEPSERRWRSCSRSIIRYDTKRGRGTHLWNRTWSPCSQASQIAWSSLLDLESDLHLSPLRIHLSVIYQDFRQRQFHHQPSIEVVSVYKISNFPE